MTAYGQILGGKVSSRSNKKDGGPLNRQRDYNEQLEELGFARTDWNKHSYTWQGEFPVFILAPGIIEDEAGIVAKCEEVEILFPYGAAPTTIKAQLDDKIFELMQLQADAADPMIVEGQVIGLEIPF